MIMFIKMVLMKILIAGLVALTMMSAMVFAQYSQTIVPVPVVTPDTPSVLFDKLSIVGKGVATDSNNGVHIVKVAISEINMQKLLEQRANIANATLPAGTPSILKVGLMHFDNVLYKFANMNMDATAFSADITDKTGVFIGSISLEATTRAGRTVWVGSMILNRNTYNVYIIEAKVANTLASVKEKIRAYCGSHQAECKDIATDVAAFCQNNLDDKRCVALERAYCKGNTDDSRCRSVLTGFCRNQPSSDVCKDFCTTQPGLCGKGARATKVPVMAVIIPNSTSNQTV